MALMRCPDCQSKVSDKAVACPRCGHPLRQSEKQLVAVRGAGSVDPSGVLDGRLNAAAEIARRAGGTMVVDSRSSTEAVFTYTPTPNHFLHGLLTLFTGGLWLVVWLVVVFGGMGSETWKMTVDAGGEVTVVRI